MMNNKKIFVSAALIAVLMLACTTAQKPKEKYSVWMAKSEMQRFPKAWMLDFSKSPKWGYCQGVGTKAMLDVFEQAIRPILNM
jgi:unsaturated rhamnogalacturonyl hydrolase